MSAILRSCDFLTSLVSCYWRIGLVQVWRQAGSFMADGNVASPATDRQSAEPFDRLGDDATVRRFLQNAGEK